MTLTSGPAAATSSPASGRSIDRLFQGRALIGILLLVGVALRCLAYFGGTSLWLDEVLLARNILELPLGALLTEPLQLDQVAPRGFLLVEKISVLAFGGIGGDVVGVTVEMARTMLLVILSATV